MAHSRAYLRIASDMVHILEPDDSPTLGKNFYWSELRERIKYVLSGSKKLINEVSGLALRRCRIDVDKTEEFYKKKSLQKIARILSRR